MKENIQKALSLLIAVVMFATVFLQIPFVASAEETAVLTYTIKDGLATITNVSSEATVVEIPSEYEGYPVVGTSQFAFNTNSKATKFVVDESSEYLSTDESGVLYNKDKTRLIKFPDSSEVTEYDIPEGVTVLSYHAFAYSKNLEKVSCPSTLKSIGKYDFFHCFSLVEVVLAEGIGSIIEEAFRESSLLSKINFPSTIKSIGEGAFQGCKLSGIIELPESLTSLGSDSNGQSYPAAVFTGCPITAFSIDENNDFFSTDENGILYNKHKTMLLACPDASELTSFVVPESVTEIDDYAFSGVSGLKNITLHNNIYSVGTRAFAFSGIISFVFPANMNYVPNGMFYNCSDLVQVELHNNITIIGDTAFMQCSSLEFLDIPSSCSSIGVNAFNGAAIKSITLPEIEKVSNGMFRGCSKLESVDFTGYLTAIGESAFYGCSSLKSIAIPSSVTEIGKETFLASGLETVVLPDGITSIETSVFNGCKSLVSIEIPRSVTNIKKAFAGSLDSLTDVYYHGTQSEWEAITIDDSNSSLTNATIHYNYGKNSGVCGETLTWSFDEDSKVLSITGSGEMDSLASFEDYGWAYFKDQIEVVEFGNAAVSVGSNAFNGCTQLKEVYLSESIGSIGENAFADCSSLSIVTVNAVGFTADATSFSGNDERLIMLYSSLNTQAADYAAENSIRAIPIYYDYSKKAMKFNGELTVYSDLPYLFLSKFVKQNPGMEYLYFDKLVFDGIEPEIIDIEELENDAQAKYLTFNKIYVSLKKVKDGLVEGVTFDDFLTLLENGDFDAFMFELDSDEGKQQLTFIEILEKIVDDFVTSALRITSKIINFFRKIFK